jgi:hypothetical protein
MSEIVYNNRCFPSQRIFYGLTETFSGLSGPVGAGKTVALCYRALMAAAENPRRTGLIGAPTYPMLRDITIRTMLEILDERQIPHTYNKSEHVLYLKRSGSIVKFRPVHDYERLRGTNLAWFGLDEMTYCEEEAWMRLEARLRDPKAKRLSGFGVWTPKGYDWVYRRFIGPERMANYRAVLAAPEENVIVLRKNPQFYARMKASYDERFFEQECLGHYLNVYAGRVYHSYDPALNDMKLEFSPHIDRGLLWGIDFNVDPMASVLGQVRPGPELHVLDEIMLAIATTEQMCVRVVERAQPWLRMWQDAHGPKIPLPLRLYGDAAGNARSTKASKTDYDLIGEFFRSKPQFKLIDHVPRKNPEVKDRVNSVNAFLHDASDRVRVFIDPRCKALRRDLLEVTWKQGPSGFELEKKKYRELTHVSDALGYLIWAENPISGFHREIVTN